MGQEGSGLLARELLSAMNQLLEQNRSQMEEMKSIGSKMDKMGSKVDSMEGKIDMMEVDMNSLKEKCDDAENRQRYHDVLLKNQRWEYSAPYPNVADAHEKRTLDKIKTQTCDMRYGKCGGTVQIMGHLSYDAAILPHWMEFADALKQHQYALKCLPKETISMLNLYFMELPKTVLDLLSNALESTHFKSLLLEENQFGRDGIQFALNHMKNNPILEELYLIDNPIDDQDDVNQLCEIIRDHPSINTIHLSDCFGEGINGHDVLCSILTAGRNKLTSIVLSSNDIITEGSTFIADFLATNPILENLRLCDNYIDDEDAKSIATALKHNTNLRILDMDPNEGITDRVGCIAQS